MEKKLDGKRGSYAKGSVRTEKILRVAAKILGRNGYHATSMREIANQCGLSQAGLLHYFPSKEDLLIALMDRRDTVQIENARLSTKQLSKFMLDLYLDNKRNEDQTRLWANLATEATYPEHPAHKYFLKRYEVLIHEISYGIANKAGKKTPNRNDRTSAILLVAVWDGLQQQNLLGLNEDIDNAFKKALEIFLN